MKFKNQYLLLLAVFLFVATPTTLHGQEALSKSPTWFGKALSVWFPEEIIIHGASYLTTRIRCSNKDLTNFIGSAGKTDIGLGPAFQIEGTLTLDSLPPGLKVVDGAQGKKYMLILQGYIFSPQGKLLWSQRGFPQGGSWVSYSGSTTKFKLINKFSGSLKGCTLAVLAIGDAILIEGTSETRVILGMKRFSFNDENYSIDYDPPISKTVQPTEKRLDSMKQEPVPNKIYTDLKYVEKKLNDWKYTEVVSIPVSERKQIFYELVKYQDRTGDDQGAYKVVGKRYGLPDRAVIAIAFEGAVKDWPLP